MCSNPPPRAPQFTIASAGRPRCRRSACRMVARRARRGHRFLRRPIGERDRDRHLAAQVGISRLEPRLLRQPARWSRALPSSHGRCRCARSSCRSRLAHRASARSGTRRPRGIRRRLRSHFVEQTNCYSFALPKAPGGVCRGRSRSDKACSGSDSSYSSPDDNLPPDKIPRRERFQSQ